MNRRIALGLLALAAGAGAPCLEERRLRVEPPLPLPLPPPPALPPQEIVLERRPQIAATRQERRRLARAARR